MFASIEAIEGRLDVLVNNAGIQKLGLTERFDAAEWERVVDVHLLGAFNCSSLALRDDAPTALGLDRLDRLRGRGDRAARPGALLGRQGGAHEPDPGDGRRGRRDRDPGQRGRPGHDPDRDLLEQVAASGAIDLEKMMDEIPMHRLATTDEIANVVLFLASDDATYITGETIVVDGGWSILGIRNRPDWLRPE